MGAEGGSMGSLASGCRAWRALKVSSVLGAIGGAVKCCRAFRTSPMRSALRTCFSNAPSRVGITRARFTPSFFPLEPPSAPMSEAPHFSEKLVREALATFSPCSAAGVFGYRPRLLQQCSRAESFYFVPTLTRAVNLFASGEAPGFLQPFIAGGVSIALSKPNRGVRPLCAGDSIRRLVAKCFCHGGKNEISGSFEGQNYGVEVSRRG